ncbi:MarR family transcriptional regulator [Paenibacillus sp. CC-CFT747]|nr:MarR family transcriptional regulator [Paenibacillus sp. CC-CFT747]
MQLSILGAISRGHDLKVTDVADKVCMSGSAVSIASDQLVQMGLVERTRHRDDRRIVGLTLTEEGTRKLGSIHDGDSLYSDCLSKLQGFSADEVTQMLDTHKKLMKIFKQGA